jgi:5-methylcytosine-specific restriction protein A
MPTRPPRVCNKCRQPAPAGSRCPCTPAWSGNRAWSGGSTRKWRTLRESKLRTDPICEEPACRALATEVDHIVPLSQGGERYDWANLASLCAAHHEVRTLAQARAARHTGYDGPSH